MSLAKSSSLTSPKTFGNTLPENRLTISPKDFVSPLCNIRSTSFQSSISFLYSVYKTDVLQNYYNKRRKKMELPDSSRQQLIFILLVGQVKIKIVKTMLTALVFRRELHICRTINLRQIFFRLLHTPKVMAAKINFLRFSKDCS